MLGVRPGGCQNMLWCEWGRFTSVPHRPVGHCGSSLHIDGHYCARMCTIVSVWVGGCPCVLGAPGVVVQVGRVLELVGVDVGCKVVAHDTQRF